MSARANIDPALPPVEASRVESAAPERSSAPVWRLSSLYGRVGELSGSRATAVLTLAMRLVLEAQRQGEPVAWLLLKKYIRLMKSMYIIYDT